MPFANPFRTRSTIAASEPPSSEEATEDLRQAFPDVELSVMTETLLKYGGDRDAAANELLSTMGTSQLPPLKECVICLSEPRETRFSCGHACCCLQCTTHLLAAGDAKCPTCRASITSTSTGADSEGVPIARQRTFEPQQAAASSTCTSGGARSVHVRLFGCCQGCLSTGAWRAANRLWQRMLAPVVYLGLFLAVVVLESGMDLPTSGGDASSPMPSPLLPPPSAPASEAPAVWVFPSRSSASRDALMTLAGALCACVWHGVRLRPIPRNPAALSAAASAGRVLIFGLFICAIGVVGGALLLPVIALLATIGGELAKAVVALSPLLVVCTIRTAVGGTDPCTRFLEGIFYAIMSWAIVAFLASSLVLIVLQPFISLLAPYVVQGCCFFLGWQLMIAEARSAPDAYVSHGVRYGRGLGGAGFAPPVL